MGAKGTYPMALNSLGEIICLGCGTHMEVLAGGRRQQSWYCSGRCRGRVERAGGRWTRAEIAAFIAAMDAL